MLRSERESLKQRKRDLQEQRRFRYGDRDRVNAKIAHLNGFIQSADMSDPSMRKAVAGWRQEIKGLVYERRQISEGINSLKQEIEQITNLLAQRF